jgi:hypothetical protein
MKFDETFKFKHVKTTSFHPRPNRSLERTHGMVKDLIRTSLHDNDEEWDEILDLICLGYNTSLHETTGFTPFKLTFGKKAFSNRVLSYNDMFTLLQKQLSKYLSLAQDALMQSKKRYLRD